MQNQLKNLRVPFVDDFDKAMDETDHIIDAIFGMRPAVVLITRIQLQGGSARTFPESHPGTVRNMQLTLETRGNINTRSVGRHPLVLGCGERSSFGRARQRIPSASIDFPNRSEAVRPIFLRPTIPWWPVCSAYS